MVALINSPVPVKSSQIDAIHLSPAQANPIPSPDEPGVSLSSLFFFPTVFHYTTQPVSILRSDLLVLFPHHAPPLPFPLTLTLLAFDIPLSLIIAFPFIPISTYSPSGTCVFASEILPFRFRHPSSQKGTRLRPLEPCSPLASPPVLSPAG